MNKTLVLFDFDGTLTRSDSLLPFLRTVIGGANLFLALVIASPHLIAYALRIIRNDVAKEILLQRTLGGLPIEYLRQLGGHFAKHKIENMLREDMLKQLRAHQSKGHCCVLVSASLDIYLEPWAKLVGFDHCIATSLAVDSKGFVTGKIKGKNCHGQEKERRVRLLQNELGTVEYVYAYGDSRGDASLLEMANEGYWVKNGQQRLVGYIKKG